MFKDRKLRKANSAIDWEKKKTVKTINGGNNSTNFKDIDPTKRAIHIHGGIEYNLVGYMKYYSCGNTKITKGSEFTRETTYNKRYFFKHW